MNRISGDKGVSLTRVSRRTLLQGAVAAAGCSFFGPISGCTRHAVQAVPPPDVSCWPPIGPYAAPEMGLDSVVSHLAGVRPYRRGSVRVEAQRLSDRFVVHHYGHGGAGITLSPATAADAVALLDQYDGALPPRVAVLGAGVVGLTTADLLLDRGCRVTIYADKLTPNTTSDVAGGQFAPATVAIDRPETLERWMSLASKYYLARCGMGCGIQRTINFTAGRAGMALRQLPEALFRRTELDALPIENLIVPGHAFETLVITPPVYLPWLTERVAARGAVVRVRRIDSQADLLRLPERVVFNCLGMGSGDLFDDDRLIPIRGRLVKLKTQSLGYLLSHPRGYLFSRPDGVVLGGTYGRGETDIRPDVRAGLDILNRHRRFFGQPAVISPTAP